MAETQYSPEVDKVRNAYTHSRDHWAKSRDASEKAMRYVNNNPYSPDEITDATNASKPLLRYNILIPILSALEGNEQLSRKRAKFKSLNSGSDPLVSIVQGRWNALNDEDEIEEKIQVAMVDGLIKKVGAYIERRYYVNEMGYLDFGYRVIDSMRVYPDPQWKAADNEMDNCRWVIKEGWETIDVIIDRYGPKNVFTKEKKLSWWNRLTDIARKFTGKHYSSNEGLYDKENDTYQILEMQERQFTKMIRVFTGSGYVVMTPEEFVEAKANDDSLEKVLEFSDTVIWKTVIVPYFDYIKVLDEVVKQKVANFDVFPLMSFSFNMQASEQTALIDLLLDIQDDINKGKSQQRDYVTQRLAGGLFIDKKDNDLKEQLDEHGNESGKTFTVRNLNANTPVNRSPEDIPSDTLINASDSLGYAKEISNVNEALVGGPGKSGESGKLFEAKFARASAAVNPYFKQVSKLRKALAKDFIDNFGFVYSEDNRIINTKPSLADDALSEQILNLTMFGSAEVLNNVRNASLHVELDEGEDNKTNREDNFNNMLALTNVIGQINPGLVDILTLVESAPIEAAKKMADYIKQQLESQAEDSEQQAQIEKTKKQLENLAIQRGIITDQGKLDNERAKTEQSVAQA